MALGRRAMSGKRAARWWMLAAIASLAWVFGARLGSPPDGWDQTQPKTVSYTTDIVVNGRWILPIERGEEPATKPPLFNWIATPAVHILGCESDFGHRLPSMLALAVAWLAIARLGNALDAAGGALGWVAATILPASYAIAKLGALARPDMLLALWILLGWMSITAALVGAPPRRRLVAAFWICAALAVLTKGPAAIVLPAYLAVAGRVVTGTWRAAWKLELWWGLAIPVVAGAAWVMAVYRIDPSHVRDTLWEAELYGRVTGTGPEGGGGGAARWITSLPNLPFYYLVRFAPWSIAAIVAMVVVARGAGTARIRPWLSGATALTIVVVIVFSLSAGKRADYLAVAYAPGALLAAWWLTRGGPRAIVVQSWVVPTLAAAALAVLTMVELRRPGEPYRGFSGDATAFIRSAREVIDADPAPVVFRHAGESHLQAYLGGELCRLRRAPRRGVRHA